MVLGNRRHRILFVALAAMDVACLLPFVLTWIQRGRIWVDFPLPAPTAALLERPFALFAVLWLLMVTYMVGIDLLNRTTVATPQREFIIIALVVATSVLGVRFVLYPSDGMVSLSWIQDTVGSIVNFAEGILPPLLLILVNTFLWIRVAMAADRELSFFSVGVSFRLGMLLALIGGTLLTTIGGQPATVATLYFALFFSFGLAAMALARIDEKSVGATGRSGQVVSNTQLLEITALVALILGAVYSLQRFMNPGSIRSAVALFDPAWRVLGWILTTLLLAVFLIIGPILERLILALERLAADAEPIQPAIQPPLPVDYVGVETMLREWTALRYCLVIGVVLAVIAVLWFFFVQPEGDAAETEDEEDDQDEARSGVIPEVPRLSGLRNWLRLLRNYGMSRRLLNAVSVQNMYANLSRLARIRGYPRLASQPPDVYLAQLKHAFPDQDVRLERLTLAYMRVHYGDLPVEAEELESLRDDYAKITETSDPKDRPR